MRVDSSPRSKKKECYGTYWHACAIFLARNRYQFSDSQSIIQMHPLKRFQEGQKSFWRNDVDGQDQRREKSDEPKERG